MIAGVAAGHPATADAGVQMLRDGGSAADAAVAATLASCVAETLMTGLLGGGHAIVFDATTGRVRNLDCFVAAPSGRGAPMEELRVPFGEELVHYAIGPASFEIDLDSDLARATAVAIAAAVAIAIAVATAAARAAGLALLPAGGAARRLIGKALLRVELLLAAGEDEIHPTVPTRDCFVCVTHRSQYSL